MPDLPDFTSCDGEAGRTNAQLTVTILDGKGKLMPAFRGRIDQDQARALVAYVRAFGPASTVIAPDRAPASDFEQRFRRLREEWDALQKQLDELSKKPPGK
jgi:hypothetical protein